MNCLYISFRFYSHLLYLLILGAEGYCCTLTHSITHTHTHTHTHDRSSLDEGWARRLYSYLKTQSPRNGLTFTLWDGIQTCSPSKQEAAEALDYAATGLGPLFI
jgi:hypothetical protein